jgi:leader peptidase (prepilin peptidase)/N-methyltransferase
MLNFLGELPEVIWTCFAFLIGSAVGSLLNVCIARIPMEKSILWPLSSRCGACLQPIRWYDNLPLISYWLLRGRCRRCGSTFSIRYFLVELLTAMVFAALFWLEVYGNVRDSAYVRFHAWDIRNGMIPMTLWLVIVHRWILASFLIVAAACDVQSREIPLSVTVGGTVIGLFFSFFLAWPWPEELAQVPQGNGPWWLMMPPNKIPIGAQLWPYWGPAINWLPHGSVLSGVATSVTGLLVGTWLLRGVRFLATKGLGREALGLGDADLMMLVGAFLGWQAVVAGFFAGALCAIGIAVISVLVFRDDSLPFGPGLALGAILVTCTWRWLGPSFAVLFFNGQFLPWIVGGGGAILFILCWLLGRIRGPVVD